MMRKTITRTMATSTIHAHKLTMEGNTPKVEALEPLTVTGKATEKDALKALKEMYGKSAPVVVSSIDISEETYEISVDDFLKYATKIDKETVETN